MQDHFEIKAVEMTRRIRDAHNDELQGKTPEERLAFYRDKARALHAELGHPEEVFPDRASAEDRPRPGR